MRHHAAQSIRPREQMGGFLDLTGFDELAHARAGDVFAANLDGFHNFEQHTRCFAQRRQPLDVAATSPTEVKIRPFDDRPRVEPPAHDLYEKFVGRKLQ
jgi:hypothetical protein